MQSLTHPLAPAMAFVLLADAAYAIANSAASWKTKYAAIFSDELNGQLRKTGVDFDYYDTEAGYESEVTAFISVVTEKSDELRILIAAVEPVWRESP